MSAVNLAELVADLRQHHDRRPVRSAPSLAGDAADFIERIAAAVPACPPCPDCPDSGRMDVFRALAIARAVMQIERSPHGPGWVVAGQRTALLSGAIDLLRAVKP